MNSLILDYPVRLAVKLRGAAMVTLGCFALIGTGDQVTDAMNAVGFVVCATALVEGAMLLRNPVHRAVWWLTLSDTLLALVYGGLTLLLPIIVSSSALRAVAAIDAWLLAATLYAGVLALHAWDHHVPRLVLVVWMLLNAVLAIAGPADPPVATVGLFVGGALYTGLFGALELAGVLWLDRVTARTPRPSRQYT